MMFNTLLYCAGRGLRRCSLSLGCSRIGLRRHVGIYTIIVRRIYRHFGSNRRTFAPGSVRRIAGVPRRVVGRTIGRLLRTGLLIRVQDRGGNDFRRSVVLRPVRGVSRLACKTVVRQLFACKTSIIKLTRRGPS